MLTVGHPSAVLIKRSANRRLYAAAAASYVTAEQLRDLIAAGITVTVRDAQTSADITKEVLTARPRAN